MRNTIKNTTSGQINYPELISKLEYGVLVIKPLLNANNTYTFNIIYTNPIALNILKTIKTTYLNQILNDFLQLQPAQKYERKINSSQGLQIRLTKLENNILLSLKKTIKKRKILNDQKFNFIINKQGYITYADSIFTNNIKYIKKEILNKNFQALLYKKKQWIEILSKLERKGHIRNLELILKNKNGEITPININLDSVYNSFGTSIAYKGTLQVNELDKETKNQHLQNIKQKLNTTEKIAKLVAHEVRNPITNINLALAQLEQELPNNDNKHNFCIELIRRNCGRINMLVNQLLNTSSTEYLKFKKYSINSIIHYTLQLASDRIRLNEIAIIKILTKNTNIDIDVDIDKITTALLNIIINAVEAMEPQKGILTVRTDTISNSIIITIKDNGVGIERQNIKQIFNPFFTNKETGMGLGLTSAYNIIHSHNGEIKISSKEKKGSTFSIYFYK